VLWKGVQAFDVTIGEKFNLPIMCIWNVHGFPTYGLFESCVEKGHIRCPPYGLATKSHSSRKLKKMLYCGSLHYLPWNHLYKHNQTTFNREIKIKVPPMWVFASYIIKWAME
jgi:hypothetical protein